jgi:hypothetical protein
MSWCIKLLHRHAALTIPRATREGISSGIAHLGALALLLRHIQ